MAESAHQSPPAPGRAEGAGAGVARKTHEDRPPAGAGDEAGWRRWRSQVALAPEVLNMNVGSCSPTCMPALRAQLALEREQAADPVRLIWRTLPVLQERTRTLLAARLRVPAREVAFGVNASFAVNTILRSLGLGAGDEILTTDQEYPHYQTLLKRLEAAQGVKVVRVPLPAGAAADASGEVARRTVAAFAAAYTPRTRLLLVSHVSCLSGMTLPVAALVAGARARGVISLVDGAHAFGMFPLDLPAIGADFYTANIHKWMMGPVGAAFLHVAETARGLIEPLITMSWFHFQPEAADDRIMPDGPTRWQMSHEYQGTRNLTAWAAAAEAFAFRDALGGDQAVFERMCHLRAAACRALEAAGLVRVSPNDPESLSGMIAFETPAPAGAPFDPGPAVLHLRDRLGVEMAMPPWHDGRWLLRISCAWFHAPEDYVALAARLAACDWAAIGR